MRISYVRCIWERRERRAYHYSISNGAVWRWFPVNKYTFHWCRWCRNPGHSSAVDELFRNVPHATPKSMSSPEICEAMDIMCTNVVATVIGLTGTANLCDDCWWHLSYGANSDIRAIFLGGCSMSGICSAAVPAVDDASVNDSTKSFFWRLGSKTRPRLDGCIITETQETKIERDISRPRLKNRKLHHCP